MVSYLDGCRWKISEKSIEQDCAYRASYDREDEYFIQSNKSA